MSQLQVTTLEANTLSANVITAGQTTVNSTGLYVSNSTAVVNTSSIFIGNSQSNITISSTISEPWILVGNPTNYLKNAQNFANISNWAYPVGGVNITPNQSDAYGTNTAYLVRNDGSGFGLLQFTAFATIPAPNTGSLYCSIDVKAESADMFTLNPYFSTSTAEINTTYNLSTGTVAGGDVSNAGIISLGNGWYRCMTIVPSPPSAGILYYRFWVPDRAKVSTTGCYFANAFAAALTTSIPNETVNTQIFTANGIWVKPSWATTNNELVIVHMWGGGGGGFGNSTYSAGAGGGAFVFGYYKASQLGSTANVVVGLGGTNLPTVGGSSSFADNSGKLLVAFGGGGGRTAVGAGGGGGTLSAGTTATTQYGGAGGAPLGGVGGNNNFTGGTSTFGGGGGGWSGNTGGASIFGGGGGTYQTAAGNSIFGGGGGSAISAVGTSVFGGRGGNTTIAPTAPGGGGGQNSAGARGEVRVWVIGPGSTTAGAPTYTLTANTTTIYGGDAIQYTVSTTNVANNTTLYYTLNASSSAVSTDFNENVNGSVVINGGTATFTLTSNNKSYSSNTSMIFDVRLNSTTGTIVAANNSCLIRKTPTVTYLGYVGQETGQGRDTTYTITSATLGTASSTRKIIVGVTRYRNDSALTPTVTVAGVTATLVTGSAGNYNSVYLYIADVPTGTSGNIVVTNAVEHYGGVSIGWWAAYDLQSSVAISSNSVRLGGSSLTHNTTTLNQSILVWIADRYASNFATTSTLSGTAGFTTKDFDQRYDTTYFFYGFGGAKNMISGGTPTIVINLSSSSTLGSSFAAFR